MSGLPTGVVVVTALIDGRPAGATVNAVSSLSLSPPLILACLDQRSRTLEAVRMTRRFGVNVLHRGQEDSARRFASKAAPPEKWESVAWRERAGVPALDDVALFAACELRAVHPGGDHEIAIGEVAEIELDPAAEPLVFWAGGYGAIGAEGFRG